MLLQSILYGNPDYYPPMIHGAEVLDQNGFQQEILSRRVPAGIIPAGAIDDYYPACTTIVRIKDVNSSHWQSYVNFALKVIKASRKDADLFLGYNMHGLLIASVLSKLHRKPLVYHCHDYVQNSDVFTMSARIFKIYERLFARTANLVIVPDRARAEVMVKELNLPEFPLIVANCPVHTPNFQSAALAEALSKQGKHFDRIVWRQGMINKMHALEVTIRSMPFWSSTSWGFVIMGPCDVAYKESLTKLAIEIGVADRFVILPALGDYREVANYTVGANIGHALYEPFQVNHKYITTASNKTMEYQAAGLPLLLSDTPSNRQFIEKYGQGIIVDVASPRAIAEGINEILSNTEMAKRMSEGSRLAFQEEFNYEHQYRPVIKRMEEITQQRRKNRNRQGWKAVL